METTMPPFATKTALSIGFTILLVGPTAALADSSQPAASNLELPDGWTEHVLGGNDVSPGQWPDTAGVFFSGELGCTGTLVAPNVVLTAGHCIDPSVDKVLLNSTDSAGQGGEEIAVTQSIAYPNWETTYDVGILLLATPSTVPPRIIARGCAIDQFYSSGAPVQIVGYGATDVQGEQYGTKLLQGTTTIVDADCKDASCNAGVSPGGELIAGGNGVDSCFGDSGGPVYLTTAGADYLIGVTSRGLNSSATPCGGGGIYTRADAVAGWIEQTADVTLAMADCQNDDNGGGATDPDGDEGAGEPGEPDGPGGPSGDEPGEGDGTQNSSGGAVSGGCSTGGTSTGGMGALLFGFFALVGLRRRES